ncbi:MAG: HAMP domain-containing protein [Patescibacteria group bacterium]
MNISNITLRIALPIIIIGIFTIVVFIALGFNKFNFSFYIVVFLLAVFIFLFGFAIGQEFSSPVKKLLKRATELSKGDLATRVYLETKDEFGELARIFNKIAEELEESHSKEEKTEKSVDIKVRAKTQDLEEIIDSLDQKVKNRTIELEKIMNESEKLREEVKNKEKEAIDFKTELYQLRERLGMNKNKKENSEDIPIS